MFAVHKRIGRGSDTDREQSDFCDNSGITLSGRVRAPGTRPTHALVRVRASLPDLSVKASFLNVSDGTIELILQHVYGQSGV